ncbi:hypothetical protein PPROV_000795600 [Pycnococcus provasolii]|uniref:Uncharacterized protein n=1 Tax=Pycnococcus provasolii TaxID=41880 RepID=A0A830HWG1_9CHLO|nr:hypothetical protein PPROV_000795600 [Pycnococcus provasolii]
MAGASLLGRIRVFELGYFRRRRRTLLSSAVESLGTYRHLLNQQRLSIEGYPRGAFRHTLPSDTSERDQYLQLLEKCDKMILLNGVYLGLQTPIFLGIAANVARLLMRIPGVYTFLHTTKRALPEMGLLVALMMMFTTLGLRAFATNA